MSDTHVHQGRRNRRLRADAQRNLDLLLQAVAEVFSNSGVDAAAREITDRAGLGIGTLYRHFPRRADLIAAVFRREIDACADVASLLATTKPPFVALAIWMERYTTFIATKRGLAQALHLGDPAFDTLPGYFEQRVRPALRTLLDTAMAAGIGWRTRLSTTCATASCPAGGSPRDS